MAIDRGRNPSTLPGDTSLTLDVAPQVSANTNVLALPNDVDSIRFGFALCIEANFPELCAEYERLDVGCVLLSAGKTIKALSGQPALAGASVRARVLARR
ncbi:hypothetical protein [Streptomyces sp. NPDC056144]|uniref:hypothetical protein n=1 Tax=unclassified Streptomyces TaxID=2593676 RepID=UPI0035E272C8